MQIIDNINTTVKGDLQSVIHKGSKLSIAAACFSIYAYQELKKQLEDSGYMARVAYVMNDIMGRLGLSGRASLASSPPGSAI